MFKLTIYVKSEIHILLNELQSWLYIKKLINFECLIIWSKDFIYVKENSHTHTCRRGHIWVQNRNTQKKDWHTKNMIISIVKLLNDYLWMRIIYSSLSENPKIFAYSLNTITNL